MPRCPSGQKGYVETEISDVQDCLQKRAITARRRAAGWLAFVILLSSFWGLDLRIAVSISAERLTAHRVEGQRVDTRDALDAHRPQVRIRGRSPEGWTSGVCDWACANRWSPSSQDC